MSGKSNYLEALLLNWIKGYAFPTAPSAVYVALFNGDPTDAGTGGTEVTTTIRTAGRLAATFGSITVGSGADTIANTSVVNYGNAVGSTSVTHFALFDAASGGNMLYSNALSGGSQAIASGAATSFAIGAIVVSED